MAMIMAGRQGWTPKANPMQLWLGLAMMLVRVWQVGQDSLLMVLASTLQLWFILNLLLLFVRILELMQLWLNLSMVLARVWEGLGVVLMLLARTVAISM